MKYCYHCGHTTGGKPLYCNSCGRTYDVKLCPKLHVNPRLANACSSCGSRVLSTPQPKVPIRWRVAQWVVQIVSAIVLICLIGVIHKMTGSPKVLLLGIAILSSVWWIVRDYLRSLVREIVSSASS
jgi:DNA-directed RNA polymerase subunit RPC12/RpoP